MERRDHAVLTFLFALASAACGSTSSPAPNAQAGKLTYFHDVKPIVDAKCTGCHVAGGLAPFALTSAPEVCAQALAMQSATGARIMPPWMAAPGCTSYVGDESLTDDQIKTIGRWADDGALAGDASDEGAPLAKDATTMSRVDSTLEMPSSYTPQVHPDDYRCFLIDWPETTTKFVTGFRARPGNPLLVHHVIAFLATPSTLSTFAQLDTGSDGWQCFGGPGGSPAQAAMVGAWAPGSAGADFPAGTGLAIAPGSKIVLQVHYNTLTTPTGTDKTSLDFKLDDSVQKPAALMFYTDPSWLSQGGMVIPAGNPDVDYHWSFDISSYMSLLSHGVIPNGPFLLYGVSLHMHLLGTKASTAIVPAGGGADECMLDIPQWNFHWQRLYTFDKPIQYAAGDKIDLDCHWNNTQANQQTVNGEQLPAKTVSWGEGTTDEMCLGAMYVTAP